MENFFDDLDSELGSEPKSAPSAASSEGSQPKAQKSDDSKPVAKRKPRKTSPILKLVNKAPVKKDLKIKSAPKPATGKLKLSSELKKIEEGVKSARTGRPVNAKRVRIRHSPSVFPKLDKAYKLPKPTKGKTLFVPVGGLKTVGNNMSLVRYEDEILLLDGGLEFASDEHNPGADYMLPDIRGLIPEKDKIVGMLITHGHLDHIGALKNIIPALGFPKMYGSPFTIAMIKRIFEEAGLKGKAQYQVVNPDMGAPLMIGNFRYEFFRVNHTIPDSCGYYVETPNMRLMHMGDYKLDFSPRLDKPTDLANYARIASRGIDILLQETTNSYKKTWTTTEAVVTGELDDIISKAQDRVIIGNFSTLISRIQDIITIAEKYGKYIFINGRSMINHVAIAREMGYIKCKRDTIRNLERKSMSDIPNQKQIIITTGAQGEYYGGMNIMSRGEHKVISMTPRDTVVFSSSIIPGNEVPIIELKNRLHKFGIKLITIHEKEVHAGGHGGIIEQKVVVNIVKPNYIIPVHGDLSQRLEFRREAVACGFDVKKILMLDDGALVEIDEKRHVVNTRKKMPVEELFVDGMGIGSMKSPIMKDRNTMRASGVLMITFAGKTANVESRGLFYPDEVREAHKLVLSKAKLSFDKYSKGNMDSKNMRKAIKTDLEKFVNHKFDREPMVIPVVI